MLGHDHRAQDLCFHRGGRLHHELLSHLPFSVSSVTIGLILAGLICFLTPAASYETTLHSHEHAEIPPDPAHGAGDGHADEFRGHFIELFHLFHPAHMLFSAAATTAMFRRYDRRPIRIALVGFTGAVLICGLSDIGFPHVSLWMLGRAPEHVHICIVQHPALVLPFAVVGVAVGWAAALSVSGSTYYSHSLHVFISTMATIFYMVGPLGRLGWIDDIGKVFLFVTIAVMIPCCVSDIVYPLLLTRPGREAYAGGAHAHIHAH